MIARRAALFVTLVTWGCSSGQTDVVPSSSSPVVGSDVDNAAHGYVAPKKVRTYPASRQQVQAWIDAGNTKAIRAHAWDIWQAITAATPDSGPTWQTWYSGQEVFADGPSASSRVSVTLPLERPRQGTHHVRMLRMAAGPGGSRIPVDTFERVFAFNRFTATTAQYIWNHRLNDSRRLTDTLVKMQRAGTPLASLAILTSADSTDASSFVIKCVFQFIAKDSITAIPFWAGNGSKYSTDSLHPPPRMWRQAVAVDPSGRLKAGDSVFKAFNGQPAQWLRIVPMSAFYHRVVTAQDSAALTQFGAENGDDLGFNSDTSLAAVQAAARPGNYALLMAMHVTGKEIANWTWQTFWWSANPSDPLTGADRPASIPAPWKHYNMTVAYSMLTKAGQPLVAFNPYLETSLAGYVPVGSFSDSVSWTGVSSNCMSCHRRAAVAFVNYPPHGTQQYNTLYGPAAQVSAGDSLVFVPQTGGGGRVTTLKTDFLWSVAIRAHPFPAGAGSASP